MLLSLASRDTTSDFYACVANIYNSHFPIALVMTNLDCQLDYIWNQLTFLQGIVFSFLFFIQKETVFYYKGIL